MADECDGEDEEMVEVPEVNVATGSVGTMMAQIRHTESGHRL